MIKKWLSFFEKESNFKSLTLAFLIIYIVSLCLNLGLAPFRNEEPRRALVALEMLYNQNFLVTTILGETFYDHPPLFNIILAISAAIFGEDAEFSYRFPVVISFLLSGLLVFLMSKKYIGEKFAIITTFFYLVSLDLYFFFSILAEIDIFFSFLILLVFFSIYHFYQQGNFTKLFLFAYLFTTLGFFTKGVVAPVFLGVTLLVFFWSKKALKKLFLPIHFISALLMFGCIFLFFYAYHQFDDAYALIDGMWGITQDKSILDKNNNRYLFHFFFFPSNLLANLFPATLLLIFLFSKKVRTVLKAQPYIYFLGLIVFANFLVYWVSPGAKMRYTYMLYPLCISILVYALVQFHAIEKKKTTFVFYFLIGLTILLGMACFVAPFISFMDPIPYMKVVFPIFGILLLALAYFQWNSDFFWNKILLVLTPFVVMKLLFALTVFPIMSLTSQAAESKNDAQNILHIAQYQPIKIVKQENLRTHKQIPIKFYRTLIYMEMYGDQIVQKVDAIESDGYYLTTQETLNKQYEILYEIDVAKTCMVFFKKE